MSSRDEEKLPTSINSKDDDNNCTKSKDHIKLDGNRDKTLYSKGKKLKKSLTKVNNPPCNPNVDDEKICKNVMQSKTPKTLKEFENDHLNRLKLDILLRDSDLKEYKCCHCKYDELKNHQMSAISSTNDTSFQTFMVNNGDEITEITTTILNKLENAMESGSESCPSLSSLSIDNDPQTNQNSGSIDYSEKSPPKIVDGRLFFKNEWYRRGQHIDIEGEFLVKFSAVICGISSNSIWVMKHSDNGKFRIHIDHLLFGEMSIVRKIPVDIIQGIMSRYS